MEAILPFLVLLVGAPVLIGLIVLLNNRRVFFEAGWALARWASGEPWRPPALCILIGLVALGVAQWSAKADAPILFVVFVAVLVWFLSGVTGYDYNEEAGSEPSEWNRAWGRRSRH